MSRALIPIRKQKKYKYKTPARNLNYYQRNKDKLCEKQREYYQRNKEKCNKRRLEYYHKNKERQRALMRQNRIVKRARDRAIIIYDKWRTEIDSAAAIVVAQYHLRNAEELTQIVITDTLYRLARSKEKELNKGLIYMVAKGALIDHIRVCNGRNGNKIINMVSINNTDTDGELYDIRDPSPGPAEIAQMREEENKVINPLILAILSPREKKGLQGVLEEKIEKNNAFHFAQMKIKALCVLDYMTQEDVFVVMNSRLHREYKNLANTQMQDIRLKVWKIIKNKEYK